MFLYCSSIKEQKQKLLLLAFRILNTILFAKLLYRVTILRNLRYNFGI